MESLAYRRLKQDGMQSTIGTGSDKKLTKPEFGGVLFHEVTAYCTTRGSLRGWLRVGTVLRIGTVLRTLRGLAMREARRSGGGFAAVEEEGDRAVVDQPNLHVG